LAARRFTFSPPTPIGTALPPTAIDGSAERPCLLHRDLGRRAGPWAPLIRLLEVPEMSETVVRKKAQGSWSLYFFLELCLSKLIADFAVEHLMPLGRSSARVRAPPEHAHLGKHRGRRPPPGIVRMSNVVPVLQPPFMISSSLLIQGSRRLTAKCRASANAKRLARTSCRLQSKGDGAEKFPVHGWFFENAPNHQLFLALARWRRRGRREPVRHECAMPAFPRLLRPVEARLRLLP